MWQAKIYLERAENAVGLDNTHGWGACVKMCRSTSCYSILVYRKSALTQAHTQTHINTKCPDCATSQSVVLWDGCHCCHTHRKSLKPVLLPSLSAALPNVSYRHLRMLLYFYGKTDDANAELLQDTFILHMKLIFRRSLQIKTERLVWRHFFSLSVRASVCELASTDKSCVGFSWNLVGAFCKVLWSKCEFCKNWPRRFLTLVRAY